MKRLRTILLFLLLGAVVNVGVAWACASWSPLRDTITFSSINDDFQDYWQVHYPEAYPPDIDNVQDADVRGFGIQNGWLTASGPSIQFCLVYSASGWPMKSLSGCVWASWPKLQWSGYISPDGSDSAILLLSKQVPQSDPRQQRMLPLRVIRLGFLVNTFFYALFLWLLISSLFVFRKHLRYKRGLCVKCGYDLKGAEHDACPECGEIFFPILKKLKDVL